MKHRRPYKILVDGLRAELKASFGAEKVRAFIGDVSYAIDAHNYIKKLSNEKERKRVLLAKLNAAKSLQKLMEPPERSVRATPPALPIPYPKRLSKGPFTLNLPDAAAVAYFKTEDIAREAVAAYVAQLEAAVRTIERGSRGKPRVDPHGFIAYIAHAYLERLEAKPTTTPGAHFSNVVALILQHESPIGRLPRDVSRHVRAALKAM